MTDAEKPKFQRSLRWLFDSDDYELQQKATNYFASFIDYHWYQTDCDRFLRIINSHMSIREFFDSTWERAHNGWEI